MSIINYYLVFSIIVFSLCALIAIFHHFKEKKRDERKMILRDIQNQFYGLHGRYNIFMQGIYKRFQNYSIANPVVEQNYLMIKDLLIDGTCHADESHNAGCKIDWQVISRSDTVFETFCKEANEHLEKLRKRIDANEASIMLRFREMQRIVRPA